MNLEKAEKDMLKESIALRLKICDDDGFYKQQITILEEILKIIDSDFVELKPAHKALLIGCIKELVVYPNAEFLNISDFEVLMFSETDKEKLKYIDIGLILIKKLQRQKDQKLRTFEPILSRIDLLLKSNEVYYSETKDGKIYKVGIKTGGNMGIDLVMEGTSFSNFDYSRLSRDSYEKSANPSEVLQKLERYALNNQLTENQERVKKILEKVCEYQE